MLHACLAFGVASLCLFLYNGTIWSIYAPFVTRMEGRLRVKLFVIAHIFVSQLFIARLMPGLNKKSLEATAKNMGELTALITCADIAALYDGQDYLMKRFEQSSLHLLRAKMKIQNRNALSVAILPMFRIGGYLAPVVSSSTLIADGYFTFGDLTAASQYHMGISGKHGEYTALKRNNVRESVGNEWMIL